MQEHVFGAILPAVLALVATLALTRRADLFASLTHGAKEGLKITLGILPTLCVLFCAIYMFRASGAFDLLSVFLTPVARLLGIPAECLPIALLRPFSGSGTLALGAEIIAAHGVDSIIGRTAAVMLGSTETTFYVLAVYSGGAGIRNSRYAIPAALIADLVGMVTASAVVRWMF